MTETAPPPAPGQPQPDPQQRMQALGAMMMAGGQPPAPPARRGFLRTLAGGVWSVLRWLFAHPGEWLLPSLKPMKPAPEQDYHGGGRLHALSNAYPLATWRPAARVVMALTLIFVVWANYAVLDEVAVADGEAVPEGKVKVIQHLEGGVVREISAVEGAVVKEGEPLVLLDLPVSSMNRDELQVRLDGLTLQRARLEAELDGTPLNLPPEEARRQPTLLESERRAYDTRRASLRATLSVLQDQVRQKGLEVEELETKQRGIINNLRLAQQRLAMSTDLIRSGLTSKMDHVTQESTVEDLKGQLESIRAAIPRAMAAQSEASSRTAEEKARYQRTAQQELGEVELNIARTRELLTQASGQANRTQIVSPIDGIVKNLRANTIGGVVKPGDPIMEIVPLHERLQIDAKLSPMDRGYVQAGQRATVKLSAYDYTTYGGLDGEVILVAPDTTMTPDNQPYYRVVVQTDKAYLGDDSAKRPITAGMQASVEIHTGTRTVMEYLVKPVLKLRHEAFRER